VARERDVAGRSSTSASARALMKLFFS
jgi:hypothetical protein